jgi:2-polyprenyl-3-methyl-5-hydroxy-6-metoxy-1,4-benzoquinol methylase
MLASRTISAARHRLRPLRRSWRATTHWLRRSLPASARATAKPHLVRVLRRVNQAMRAANRFTHRLQTEVEWGWPPPPEWFDHHLGTHYAQESQSQTIGEERGVYATLAVPAGGRILDLCCGDGWYAKHFFARKAASVVSVDYDADALAYARRVNAHPAVTYEHRDVRSSLPDGPFDGVVWSGAIEHFTEAETTRILEALRARMRPGAVLAGDTILAARQGVHLVYHAREYSSERDLVDVLSGVFGHACAWRSEHPTRTELYFFASDDRARLPFLDGKITT